MTDAELRADIARQDASLRVLWTNYALDGAATWAVLEDVGQQPVGNPPRRRRYMWLGLTAWDGELPASHPLRSLPDASPSAVVSADGSGQCAVDSGQPASTPPPSAATRPTRLKEATPKRASRSPCDADQLSLF